MLSLIFYCYFLALRHSICFYCLTYIVVNWNVGDDCLC